MQAGDANTTFFHSCVIQRRNSNFITRIEDEQVGEIKQSTVKYFARLFTADRNTTRLQSCPFELPQVTNNDNELAKIPELEELFSVVHLLIVLLAGRIWCGFLSIMLGDHQNGFIVGGSRIL